jgi:hypothetical protein
MGTIQVLDILLFAFEVISCITGFVMSKKLNSNHWKWFPYYLTFIVLAELPGKYFLAQHMYEECTMYYNIIVIPIEFSFFYWLFYMQFRLSKQKNIPIFCGAIYLLCWSIDNFYLTKVDFWFSFSYTCGNILLLVLILTYFINLVTTDAILNYKQDMLFWVSTGLLLFYLGTFPYYGLRNTLVYNYRQLYITYSYIMYILNCLMYLMFTFSFIWGKPNLKYSSS